MNMTVTEHENGIREIALDGKLDIAGAAAIDLKFTGYAAGTKGKIMVDLSKVTFLASTGIRTLLSAAKAQAQRGGAFVVFAAQPLVEKVLETAGMSSIIPAFPDREAAIAKLSSVA